MNSKLQKQLLQRSKELQLNWCSFHPIQMKNFVYKRWILVVDDTQLPAHRVLWAFPPRDEKMTISKLYKSKPFKKAD
jgi:hypothetical protein